MISSLDPLDFLHDSSFKTGSTLKGEKIKKKYSKGETIF